MPANSLQSSNDLVHVRAEDASIGVHFVEDHIGEVFEKLLPTLVVSQYPAVEHVRIGHQDFRHLGPDLLSRVGRGISVIDSGGYLDSRHPLDEPVQILELVLLKGFQRENVKGFSRFFPEKGFDNGEIEDQAFSACRRGGNEDMLPILNAPDRIDLVLEQLLNAEALQSGNEEGRERGCSFIYGLNGREVPVVRSGRPEFGMVFDRIDKLGESHRFSSILLREFFFKGTGDLFLTRFHLFPPLDLFICRCQDLAHEPILFAAPGTPPINADVLAV